MRFISNKNFHLKRNCHYLAFNSRKTKKANLNFRSSSGEYNTNEIFIVLFSSRIYSRINFILPIIWKKVFVNFEKLLRISIDIKFLICYAKNNATALLDKMYTLRIISLLLTQTKVSLKLELKHDLEKLEISTLNLIYFWLNKNYCDYLVVVVSMYKYSGLPIFEHYLHYSFWILLIQYTQSNVGLTKCTLLIFRIFH